MLIEFSVANFLSIKERQTLRMDASGISEYPERVFDAGRHKLLRSAAIYGANASGKSNVLKSMAVMREIVTTSAERSSTAEIDVEPFLLNTKTENAPSCFEVVFLLDNNRYRYGFETDKTSVKAEWLYVTKKDKEKPLFLRENDGIEVFNTFKEGKGIEEKTRGNALFLAVCDQFNGIIANQIIKWFDRFKTVSGLTHDTLRALTIRNLEDTSDNGMLTFITFLNLGFDEVGIGERPFPQGELDDEVIKHLVKALRERQLLTKVETYHPKYDSENKETGFVAFDMDKSESAGTNKIFDIAGIIFIILEYSGILIIDELDAKLHPLLTQAIIRLFNSSETNPNNSQLIFATHDTNLLTYGQFRRDQIWFTEKNQYGATCLYSLVEYQEEDGIKVRKDRSFETDYIQGRYGAIPYIGDFSKLFQHGTRSEN